MNSSSHHPAPPGTDPVFAPERWLLLGHSEAWRAAAQSWMQQHRLETGPLGWRLRHGLLQLASPGTLPEALRQALQTLPRVLNVLAEADAFDTVDGGLDNVLARHWPKEATAQRAAMQVQVGELGPDFDQATELLDQADGEPVEHWLLSGRSVWPCIALPQPDVSFEAEASHVFQAWATAWAADKAPEALDAIYGGADTFLERMQAKWKDDETLQEQDPVDSAPRLTIQPMGSELAARLGGWRPAAMPLAASAAAGTRQANGTIRGVFDRSDRTDPKPDGFSLHCKGPIIAGRGSDALTVKLDLAASRWQSCTGLLLEIHADGHPVILLHWPDMKNAPSNQGRLHLEKQASLTEAHRSALYKSLELWLLPADD